MDVHWPMCCIEENCEIGSSVFVTFLYCKMIPVCPVEPVLEHGYGKRMGYVSPDQMPVSAVRISMP